MPSVHNGGIAMVYRAAEHLSMEVLQLHGANVVRFKLELDRQLWYINGCNLAPDDTSTIEGVVSAISQGP